MVPLFKNSLIVCVFNIFGESSNELVKQGTFCFIPPLVFSYIIKGPVVEFLFKGGGDVILEIYSVLPKFGKVQLIFIVSKLSRPSPRYCG